MPLSEFYSAVAQLSFTLFGLWWIVFELAPEELLGRPALRRTALHVSLGFLVPGLVAVTSLLASESLVLWRVAFAVGGAVGAVATVRLATSRDAVESPVPVALWWTTAVVESLFVVVAVWVPHLTIAAAELTPLTLAGLLLTAQLTLGSTAAWRMFIVPGREAVDADDA